MFFLARFLARSNSSSTSAALLAHLFIVDAAGVVAVVVFLAALCVHRQHETGFSSYL